MKRVLTSLAAALALAVPALAQVAQIGDTTYADFNSFFTAFQAIAPSETPTTVTLLDDLTGDLAVPGTVPVKEGQTIVFDLNGRTMEAALQREGRHYYTIDNYGTLTIKDSSAGQTGTIRARGVQNLGNGKLTIEGGTIVSVDANGGACVWNEADVTIAGGTFTTEFVGTSSDSFGPGCLNNSGTALVTGGTFHNVNRRTYAIISNMGSIEITPAEGAEVKVFGAHGGLGVDGGTAVVNGGSYSSSDFYGLYVSNDGLGADPMQAAVSVNDGTFDGKSYSVWVGSDYNNPVNSTIAIKGGTYTSIMQDAFEEVAIDHPGGAVGTGAALSVSTADGYGATTIDIQGGTFVSANGPAIYEYAAPTIVGGEAPASQVTLAISDGTFTADGEYGALLLTAMDNPQVISGGTFSTAVPEEFCTAGYASKQNADGTYSVVGWYESGVDLDADGVADAWVIRNEGDLAAFRDKVNGNVTFAGCTVTLAANLDLAGVAWIPIGEGNAGGSSKNGGFFAGTFEGGDHLIANLFVSESKADEGAGLFGWVRGATIRNLRVSGSTLSNANGAAGTHPIVELALSQEEAEGGRATLFTGTSLDDASGLEVVPVLPEGMDEPDDFVVTLEDGLFYCDLLYLADRVAGESEGVTFDANAQQALSPSRAARPLTSR